MINTYLANINNISLTELNINKLQSYYREKVRRLTKEKDKLRELASGLLIRKFFGDKPVETGKYGKPYIAGEREFNLTHSGEYVVLSVGDKEPIGCDIERLREIDFERTGRIVYCENELNNLKNAEDKKDCFFTLWTKKEAFIKCIGEGFHFAAKSIDLSCADDFITYKNSAYYFKEYMLSGYKIMLCSREDDFAENIEEVVL